MAAGGIGLYEKRLRWLGNKRWAFSWVLRLRSRSVGYFDGHLLIGMLV